MADEAFNVIAGIDTHADTHHVALITEYGRPVADQQFPATGAGYMHLMRFIQARGQVIAIGVEGTGSYGAELARVLQQNGFTVHEVNRPNRQVRRLRGKSDPIDAYQAAQAVIAQRGVSTPKSRNGAVEALRVLRTERTSAMRARVAVINQIKGLLVAAPETLRARYRALTTPALITALTRCRPSGSPTDPETTTVKALKRLAIRYRHLEKEITVIDSETDQIITAHAPLLRDLHGVGTDVASQLLITAGDNPERIRNQATFAALTGVAPIPASSGKTNRHRLSRGGDRAANSAIHHVVLVRMTSDTRTRAYVQRRKAEGKSTKEIIRCLKRYVAREIYAQLTNPKPAPDGAALRETRKRGNISLDAASTAIGVNANKLSRLERGKTRDDDLYDTYSTWLRNQQEKSEPIAA